MPTHTDFDDSKAQKGLVSSKPRPVWQSSLDEQKILARIDEFAEKNICYKKDRVIGFPGTNPEALAVKVHANHLSGHANNIGMHTNREDGACEIGFGGTQEAEREVIEMAADLMDASPHEVDGYISSGGTEANLVGCWMGRNVHLGKKSAIVCSYLTHYSVVKAANVLGIGIYANLDGSGLHLLGTDSNGHLLLDQFEQKINELADKRVSNVIVVGNAGTTMLGSVDDVPGMAGIVETARRKWPNINIHFHIDAAFGGFVVPFIDRLPRIGFSNRAVDSITIDVHKMGLSPYGSGIIMARRGHFERIKSVAPYIPGDDCTLCGSRSGTMALSCWAAMKTIGKDGYMRLAVQLTSIADTIQSRLKSAGIKTFANDINIVAVRGNLPPALREIFITHVHDGFPADLTCPLESGASPVWNIVVMNHTKMELIDELIDALVK